MNNYFYFFIVELNYEKYIKLNKNSGRDSKLGKFCYKY